MKNVRKGRKRKKVRNMGKVRRVWKRRKRREVMERKKEILSFLTVLKITYLYFENFK